MVYTALHENKSCAYYIVAMSRKSTKEIPAWLSLTLEGNLITVAMATRIARLEAPLQTEKDYSVRQGLSFNEAIATSFRVGQSYYLEYFAKSEKKLVDADNCPNKYNRGE
jgi:hypothetical protein